MLDDDTILGMIGSYKKGSRNNIITDCPFCGKAGHMYIKLKTEEVDRHGVNKSYNFDCKKCGEHGRVFKLLAIFGQEHLIQGELVDIHKKLEVALIDVLEKDVNQEINLDAVKMKMPLGFKRIYKDKYLEERGFTDFEFKKYVVGYTDLVFKLENYIIIQIQRDYETKGFLTRTTLNKKQIKELEDGWKKEGLKKQVVRYRNSESEFSKLLGGFDELNFLTNTVILVEGFFDKVRTDQMLGLDFQHEIKCCFTFGKKISIEQILLLLKKGIENVILIYDPDAVNDMKKIGFLLNKHFDSVLVGYTYEKDLGDSNKQEFDKIFSNLEPPMDFSLNKLQIIQL